MNLIAEQIREEAGDIVRELRELRRFQGPPAEFWPLLLDGLGRYAGAGLVLLLARRPDQAQGDDPAPWRRLGTWPKQANTLSNDSHIVRQARAMADQAGRGEWVIEARELAGAHQEEGMLLALPLDLDENQPPGVLVMLFNGGSEDQVRAIVERLQLLTDIPASYQMARLSSQARHDVVHFADAIDLMAVLNGCDRYMSAVMTFCNELAARYRCDRVSLGWLEGPYVRLQAISHMEKFEKKMAAVQSLEAAMEEALDQDEEIVWPDPQGQAAVSRDHARYATEQGVGHMVSLPVRINDVTVAVLSCERNAEAFGEQEVRSLRLICDQAGHRLDVLKRHDRWFGARLWSGLREKLANFLGVEHTFAKAVGILVASLLAFVIFGSWNYRVEAPFILRTDALSFMPAPFDGYVDEVEVEVGDVIRKGDVLATLDTRELLLEEAVALADIARYSREAEKARAQSALADMRIAEALKAQAEAQVDKVRYQLANATITAPFDGIVVEGDLEHMLGAPVRKGDILFKVADIGRMYVEIDLNERDIHEVDTGRGGEIAFVSSPEQKFGIRVREIDPVAVAKDQSNVFQLRADLEDAPAPWWRPGMSGIAKVDVGERSILWIATHRTIDFFRMLLWW